MNNNDLYSIRGFLKVLMPMTEAFNNSKKVNVVSFIVLLCVDYFL